MTIFRRLADPDNPPPHSRKIPLLSPLSGKVISLDHVTNQALNQRLLGEGVCISPSGYQIFCPFDGTIIKINSCCDQVRIKSSQGIVLLIQMGVGRHMPFGEGIKAKVKQAQRVKQGETIAEFDLAKLKSHAPEFLCSLTILNSDSVKGVLAHQHSVRALEDNMMTLLI